ncbi:hypothetical protein OSC52_01110 [Clostridium pasteurianum]|uniref:hypothetical protein n=1 Tax=Clostridium pasteurianum TaxID=1501 RepID=UPI00226087D1|nr:hypothetical protein [Clostridium pasteurianum]UZW14474.1 hypothetical protein OSC52_01110 [Clostridium pasteurianum]
MKKFLKISFVFSLVLVIFMSNIIVQAAVNQTNGKSDFKNILSDKELISKSTKLKEVANSSESKKLISGNEEYINIITKIDKDGNPISSSVKKYNKSNYLRVKTEQDAKQILNSTNKVMSSSSSINQYDSKVINGWIRLTINVFSSNGTNLDVYGFYEWLSRPNFTRDDIFAFAHDSNILFYNENAWSEHYYSWSDIRNPLNEGSVHLNSNNYNNYIHDIGGVGFKFDLADTCGMYPDGKTAYPYGILYVPAKKANTFNEGAQIGLNYAHEQVGISFQPSVSIPLGVDINISAASYYAKALLSNVIDFTS